jgi:hypothetical protein
MDLIIKIILLIIIVNFITDGKIFKMIKNTLNCFFNKPESFTTFGVDNYDIQKYIYNIYKNSLNNKLEYKTSSTRVKASKEQINMLLMLLEKKLSNNIYKFKNLQLLNNNVFYYRNENGYQINLLEIKTKVFYNDNDMGEIGLSIGFFLYKNNNINITNIKIINIKQELNLEPDYSDLFINNQENVSYKPTNKELNALKKTQELSNIMEDSVSNLFIKNNEEYNDLFINQESETEYDLTSSYY